VMSSANSSPRAEGASPHFPRRGDAVSSYTRDLAVDIRIHAVDGNLLQLQMDSADASTAGLVVLQIPA
jgi:hypothetical protein